MIDSRVATGDHIRLVQSHLSVVIRDLEGRSARHDASKLVSPEVEAFDLHTEQLVDLSYGSPEYYAQLAQLRPTLELHYGRNDHHPEFYADGIAGMSLVSMTEMLCDWAAACRRHADGNLRNSIEQNQKRFGYCDAIKRLLHNTADLLEAANP